MNRERPGHGSMYVVTPQLDIEKLLHACGHPGLAPSPGVDS